MKSLAEVIKLSTEYLSSKQIEPARRSAEELIADVLNCKRIDLYLQSEKPLVEKELIQIREHLKRAITQEPIEYITGKIEFFFAQIKTDSRALIPRPETEILASMISKNLKGKVLWDLCTGSGCLGISLKKKHPHLEVTLSDLSTDALLLANENAKLNGAPVEILRGDLFEPFLGKKADLIVSNPPYVSQGEYQHLDRSVKDFEPKMALVSGETGLEFYERLSNEAPHYLNEGGSLYLEIGSSQKEALEKIFSKRVWKSFKIVPDWASLNRFLVVSV